MEATDDSGLTSLSYSSMNGHLEVVEALVSAGTRILRAAHETLHTAMLTSAAAPCSK